MKFCTVKTAQLKLPKAGDSNLFHRHIKSPAARYKKFGGLACAAITLCTAIFLTARAPAADVSTTTSSLTVSGPQHVQDTTLRSGQYWGKWNFGDAQFLQVGFQPSTVYDTYHTVSLIRFDLAGLQHFKVSSATLRLYFPRNLIQQSPVPVHVYAVSGPNAGWLGGASEAVEQPDGASWDGRAKDRPWAGGPGLSKRGIDFSAEPLDTKTVRGLEGEWVEFNLPAKLAQSWMDAPDQNAGLVLRTDDDAALGQSTYIYSSEHWSGKGPQLVLTGQASGQLVPADVFSAASRNAPFQLPPMGPVYHRWLEESSSRYAVWAQDKTIDLKGTQALFPYLWDIVFRADIILPKAMLPLSRETEEIPAVIKQGDQARARQIMDDFMKYMMVFDYARDQNWYDSGPTADVLSPLQIAQFFVKSGEKSSDNGVHGIYSQYDDGRWSAAGPDSDSVEAAIQAQLKTIRERLKPTPEQYAKIETVIRQNMPLEKRHAAVLKESIDKVRKLIAQRTDGVEMLEALRAMFFNHRLFLIHQSLFSMPKYSVLMDNGDILAYTQWYYEVRHGQYSHERIGRQLADATRFLWRPSPHQEAEYAGYDHCEWADAFSGYSGTGYVLFDPANPGRVDFQTDVSAAGAYRLSFRYSLPDAPAKALQVAVNDAALTAPLSFTSTASNAWSTAAITVDLRSGPNTVRLSSAANGGPALDYLDVQPVTVPATDSAVSSNKLLPPASPGNVRALSRQLRVDLLWDARDGSQIYQVQRASAAAGPFESLPEQVASANAYSDFIGSSGGQFYYRVRAVHHGQTNQPPIYSEWSAVRKASPQPFREKELLTEVQESGFRYFYDYAHPASGLARVGTSKGADTCSIGGTGWGLYNLVVGVDRGFVTRREGAARTLKILRFLSGTTDRFHGAFPHWVNGATGKVISFSQFDDGADLVETGFLMEGVLLVREYFHGHNDTESEIRRLADQMWRGVEWDWFAREKDGQCGLVWHWSPDYGWKKDHVIHGFNECQIVYVLSLASPTHPVEPRFYWGGWQSATNYGVVRTQFGVPLTLGRDIAPPMFWTHYSYLGLDPHQISYDGRSYFDHFRDFCRVQILYANSRSNDFKGYGPLWGLTASRGPKGYRAFAPGPRDNGTIAPTAALSSMPYVPEASRAFLYETYQRYGKTLWGPFGFYDAFNFSENWVSGDYLGNEVGPIAPMIENYRSGLCWKTFMAAPEIQSALRSLTNSLPVPNLASKQP